jgi:hypothetical protein
MASTAQRYGGKVHYRLYKQLPHSTTLGLQGLAQTTALLAGCQQRWPSIMLVTMKVTATICIVHILRAQSLYKIQSGHTSTSSSQTCHRLATHSQSVAHYAQQLLR